MKFKGKPEALGGPFPKSPTLIKLLAHETPVEFRVIRSVVYQVHGRGRNMLNTHYRELHRLVTAGEPREKLGLTTATYDLLRNDFRALRREIVMDQRGLSRLRARVIQSNAFTRFCEAEVSRVEWAQFIQRLYSLGRGLKGNRSIPKSELREIRLMREIYEKDAMTTFRVLHRLLGRMTFESDERDLLLKVARMLLSRPFLASEVEFHNLPFDPSSIGKQVDTRAAAICEIAKRVPKRTKKYRSTIAEFVELAGWPRPTPALVGSTLRERQRRKRIEKRHISIPH